VADDTEAGALPAGKANQILTIREGSGIVDSVKLKAK